MQTHAMVAKAGVNALSNNLAIEMGPLGVTSNVITPRPIEKTEGMDRLTLASDADKIRHHVFPWADRAVSKTLQTRLFICFRMQHTMSMATPSLVHNRRLRYWHALPTYQIVDGGAWHMSCGVLGLAVPYVSRFSAFRKAVSAARAGTKSKL